uniref:Nitrogen regulatory protein areA GATA-like domain-containing protein n=1 Tax=Bionectria ochroleuca TaxID=29856 RepID=A0A8H7TQN6_BIOOC
MPYHWGSNWINERSSRGDRARDPELPSKPDDSWSASRANSSTVGKASRPGMDAFLCMHRADDDAAIKPQPTRHVDYLSYNWKEEDIWSSWKYVVSQQLEYRNSRRLENAIWRAWTKAKNKLKTVRPETLYWLKDSDVTWLYGPLQADDSTNDTVRTDQHVDLPSSIDKKPILKKRSISERILEESYVGAATPYQGKDGRSRITRPASGCLVSRGNSGTTSSTTYGVSYRSWKRKCVHFNEQVDHFIVIQVKGDRCSHILPASTRSGNCRG